MFPKRGAITLVASTLALILLISFKTPEAATLGAVSTTGSSNGTKADPALGSVSNSRPSSNAAAIATPAPTTAARPATGAPSPMAATPAPKTAVGPADVTGNVVSTRYGQVEVRITVDNGKITDVQAIKLPTNGNSGQISDYVRPILASEALQAQSANIDIVSGATYTSMGYARSLQSALDQAGIAAVTTSIAG